LDPNDITLRAADRLEAALERLAVALEARLAAPALEARLAAPALVAASTAGPIAELPADMVPRAEVERISVRLDEALGRLRMLLGDVAGAEV